MQNTRQSLETDLAQHAAAMLDIKRRLNTLTVVARLPPELLCKIFLFYAFSHYATREEVRGSYPAFQPYQWIAVTHVCHYWRSTALVVPFLWSTIWLDNIDWVKESLSRSKGTSLTLWSTDKCIPLDTFRLVMAQLPRIKSFHVESRSLPRELEESISPLLAKTYAKSAPQLEELSFHSAMCWERYPSYANDLSCDYRLESMFLGCDLPSLRKLHIKSYDKQWRGVLLKPTLTHLKLSAKHFLYSPHIRVTLSALAAMPLLEELDLHRVFSGYPDEDAVGNSSFHLDSVYLPALRTLRLSHNAIACALLLRYISAPALSSVVLSCSLYAKTNSPAPSPSAQLTELRLAVDERMRACAPTGPCSLALQLPSLTSGGTFRLQLWAGHQPVLTLLQDETPHSSTSTSLPFIDVRLTFDQDVYSKIEGTILDLCRAEWVSRVTSCHVDVSDLDGSMSGDVVAMLEQCTQLSELSIGQLSQSYVCQILKHKLIMKTEWTSTGFLAPNLSKLALRDVLVHLPLPPRSHRGPPVAYTTEPDFLVELQKALKKRMNDGAKVDTLVLRDCFNTCSHDIDALKSVVGFVDWDEPEQSTGGRAAYVFESLSSDDED